MSTFLTVKLDEKNYPQWRGIVLAILRGRKIDGYVLGAKPKPSELVESLNSESNAEFILNSLFEDGVTVDQPLSGWHFGSMSPIIAADE